MSLHFIAKLQVCYVMCTGIIIKINCKPIVTSVNKGIQINNFDVKDKAIMKQSS